ncbi:MULTISPECIES: MFS transporter [Nocardia]|uniref:MFS transporter n=1 Tax=Nocardia TaxID=1817 RepID=UPI0002F506F4|nr:MULTISPECIES: MFS transporter [Nocardia]
MIAVVTAYRGYTLPARILMLNQFGINLGFYMLMPYLAGYVSGSLGVAGLTTGIVLGVRNFAQQGMFLLGGTLADRLGYKPLIVAGCLLRTVGFALLALADALPALLIASAATGFAGALFNPAVRAYLAAEATDRRVEAFALFNVFYQAGMLAGPLVGLAMMAVDFRATAAVAATVFAVLTLAQLAALPPHDPGQVSRRSSVLHDWRTVVTNRPFVSFSVAMIGSYVLSFQVYLALPLQAARVAGKADATATVTMLFIVYGVLAVAGQLRITDWFTRRLGRDRGLVTGVAILAAAFLPLLLIPGSGPFSTAAMSVSAALLAVGSAAVFPFEMDTIIALTGERLVATHYGFYNTVVGVGILLGNLGTGAALDAAARTGLDGLAWAALLAVGAASATALFVLRRSGKLGDTVESPAAAANTRPAR